MPATSEKQRRAMCAAASGKSTIGIPKEVGMEYCGGKKKGGRHLSKHNANTTLTVQGHRSEGGSIVVELGEGKSAYGAIAEPSKPGDEPKPRSSARLVFSKEEAAAYPVGSTVVLHCVPKAEEDEAQETEEKDERKNDGWDDFPPFRKKGSKEDY